MTNEDNDADAAAAAALYEEDLRKLQEEAPAPMESHFGGVAGAEPGARRMVSSPLPCPRLSTCLGFYPGRSYSLSLVPLQILPFKKWALVSPDLRGLRVCRWVRRSFSTLCS